MLELYSFLVNISILRVHRHRHYCHNRQHNRYRYYRNYYYCFCVIVIATSGEEGRKSIMKEIGLGKELGDSSLENVVQFIGCVTTQSKKAILYILSCLLFEIYTYLLLFVLFLFFVLLSACFFVEAKLDIRIVLANIFGE